MCLIRRVGTVCSVFLNNAYVQTCASFAKLNDKKMSIAFLKMVKFCAKMLINHAKVAKNMQNLKKLIQFFKNFDNTIVIFWKIL